MFLTVRQIEMKVEARSSRFAHKQHRSGFSASDQSHQELPVSPIKTDKSFRFNYSKNKIYLTFMLDILSWFTYITYTYYISRDGSGVTFEFFREREFISY